MYSLVFLPFDLLKVPVRHQLKRFIYRKLVSISCFDTINLFTLTYKASTFRSTSNSETRNQSQDVDPESLSIVDASELQTL